MLTLKSLFFGVSDEKGEIDIIKDISFTMGDGKFVVITGPNGSGRSTAARLVIGIKHPTGGRIFLDGQDITDMNTTDRVNLGISFAFQQPARFKDVQVVDLFRLVTRKRLMASKACQHLAKVRPRVRDHINREVNVSLSGGKLKRIEIATAIARASRLSAFDESEVGIDLWSFQNLIQVFERVRQNTNGSIPAISHREQILNIADETVVTTDGRAVSRGTRDGVVPQIMETASAVDAYSKFCETAQ